MVRRVNRCFSCSSLISSEVAIGDRAWRECRRAGREEMGGAVSAARRRRGLAGFPVARLESAGEGEQLPLVVLIEIADYGVQVFRDTIVARFVV